MEIITKVDGKELTVLVSGRIDTTNANELENALIGAENYENVILDLKDLEYISSVGLRILLSTHKKTNGKLVIKHVNEFIMEVFDLTGFASILNISED